MPSPKKLYADIALQKEIYAAGYHRMLRNNDPRIRGAPHRWALIEAATQNAMSQPVRDKAEKSKRELDTKKGLQGDRLLGNVLPDFVVDKIAKTKPEEFKQGGMIKKTGIVKVHAGELVIKKERVAAVVKAVKAAGLKPLKK